MRFDICISFDDATYLDSQIYLLIDTLKSNISKDTILHIVTNRPDNDKVLKHIQDSMNVEIYKKPTPEGLKSRCKYLLNAVEVETDADYLVRMDVDMLALQHLDWISEQTKHGYDIIIQGENRRTIKGDNLETRIWRQIYKAMNIKMPEWKINYVENHERGRPLFNTGFMIIKSDILPTIRRRWKDLTMICEKWIQFGIHPNESAMTGLIIDEGWNWGTLSGEDVFNPIGHFRKGNYPSIELVDDCILPSEVKMLHWHHSNWLMHLAKYNEDISDIICRNEKYIPDDWWKLGLEEFMERNEK